MRVLIVDDEILARRRVAELLGDIGNVEVVGEAGDGRTALQASEELKPDLVLLDIRMPGMDGLELARHLGSFPQPPAIVFCTAYDDHALDAFERNAIDYLLKPIRRERLEAALAKVSRLGPSNAALPREAEPSQRTHLCARVRGDLVLIPVADILYLLADERYVAVHHLGGTVLIEEPLKALEEEFTTQFVRIHRNCLVVRARLAGLSRDEDGRVVAHVDGANESLEVSRRNLAAVRKLMKVL